MKSKHLDHLVRVVGDAFSIERDYTNTNLKRPNESQARSMLVYLASKMYPQSESHVCRRLGVKTLSYYTGVHSTYLAMSHEYRIAMERVKIMMGGGRDLGLSTMIIRLIDEFSRLLGVDPDEQKSILTEGTDGAYIQGAIILFVQSHLFVTHQEIESALEAGMTNYSSRLSRTSIEGMSHDAPTFRRLVSASAESVRQIGFRGAWMSRVVPAATPTERDSEAAIMAATIATNELGLLTHSAAGTAHPFLGKVTRLSMAHFFSEYYGWTVSRISNSFPGVSYTAWSNATKNSDRCESNPLLRTYTAPVLHALDTRLTISTDGESWKTSDPVIK